MAEFNCKVFIWFVIQQRYELIEECKKGGKDVGRAFKRFEILLFVTITVFSFTQRGCNSTRLLFNQHKHS